MKLLLFICFLLILALPFYLLYNRKMNVTLLIFYAGLALFTLGDFAGRGGGMNIPQIIICISMFAIMTGIEFVIRREIILAVFTALLLLSFACSWYYVAEQGAFA